MSQTIKHTPNSIRREAKLMASVSGRTYITQGVDNLLQERKHFKSEIEKLKRDYKKLEDHAFNESSDCFLLLEQLDKLGIPARYQ